MAVYRERTERKGACVHGSTNGTNGIPISFKVLPMVPLVIPLVPMVMPMVPLALSMEPLATNGTIGKPMVPMASNGTIGKITIGTIGRTPNRAGVMGVHTNRRKDPGRYIREVWGSDGLGLISHLILIRIL